MSPLKALAVDVERNLRAPLAGIANVAAIREGVPFHTPADRRCAPATRRPPSARAFSERPADILITTPESLFLLLTSNARERLRVGRDGDHRRDSRARLDQARRAPGAVARTARALVDKPLQRIGLSATQRPLDEIARFLGGAATAEARARRPRRKGTKGASDAGPRTRVCTTSSRTEPRRGLPAGHASIDAQRAEAADRHACRCRSKTWRRWASRSSSRAGPRPQAPPVQIDLELDSSAAARADARASLDAALRQQPAARRAAGRRAQRDWPASRWCARITARWRARSAPRSKIC